LNVYIAGSKWIVALPDQLELSDHVLKYFNAFFLIRVGETVQDNCNEQIEEDNADNQLEKDEKQIGNGCSATIRLSTIGLDALVGWVFIAVKDN
jgi:hypothetical protein